MDDARFIVGNDRSGTTMLRLILDRGPDLAIPPESMFLTDFDDVFEAGGPRAGEEQALMQAVWEHPKVALWDLEGPAPSVPPRLAPADAYRFIVEAPYRAYAAKHGKPHWADKTPHYVHHIDHLLRVWPRARFVVLVRDGRDVALSLRRMPFGPNNAWAATQWWARGVRAGRRTAEQHPDAVLAVRYEDVASAPATHVPRICDFLGVTYHDDMLALEKADRSKIVADQASWFPTIFEGINTTAVGRWERDMSVRDQRIFAALAGDELRALGYEPGPGGVTDISPLQERWFHVQNETLRNINFLRLRLVQERGREFRFALARRRRA
jgi:Sulfotransferase family